MSQTQIQITRKPRRTGDKTMTEIVRTRLRVRWISRLPWPWRTITVVTAPTGTWLDTGIGRLYGPYGPARTQDDPHQYAKPSFPMTPMKRPI